MQELNSTGAGGDRRVRTPHHQNHQALKCPRCDSSNTKFCYYNNYSLSQPRHFCKSCRRYWTHGGILRNIPIGGGCRKPKRSKPKTASSSSSRQTHRKIKTKSRHSCSESSPVTAAAVSVPPTNNNIFDANLETGSGIFSEIGSFTSLMSSTEKGWVIRFGGGTVSEMTSFGKWDGVENMKAEGDGGFGSLAWNGSGDEGLFDLVNTVDQPDQYSNSNWSQSESQSLSQWTDQDLPRFYLP